MKLDFFGLKTKRKRERLSLLVNSQCDGGETLQWNDAPDNTNYDA